jgi:Bacterial Ig domain
VDDSVQKVSFYAEDAFLGSATSSPFTFSWVNPKVGEYDLFARAVDAAGKSTLSQPVHITVTGVTPTVSFTAPLANSTVDPHSDVPVKVQATGIGDLTVRISLDGSHVLAELKKAPFELTWANATSGKHTLTARVTDSDGQTASASVQVVVTDLPPSVQITSPQNGDNFVTGTDITLTAKATDPDDTIKDVTFWVNHRALGKETPSAADKSVYELKWVSPEPNLYAIRAVATNSNETKTTSDAVVVSVSKH